MVDEQHFAAHLTEERVREILAEELGKRDDELVQRLRDDFVRADQRRWKRVFETERGSRAEIAEAARLVPLEFGPTQVVIGSISPEDLRKYFDEREAQLLARINENLRGGRCPQQKREDVVAPYRDALTDSLRPAVADMCDFGHRFWKEGSSPARCPHCALIGRDKALAQVAQLQRDVDVLRAQFHGITNLRELVSAEQYTRICQVLRQTSPDPSVRADA